MGGVESSDERDPRHWIVLVSALWGGVTSEFGFVAGGRDTTWEGDGGGAPESSLALTWRAYNTMNLRVGVCVGIDQLATGGVNTESGNQ